MIFEIFSPKKSAKKMAFLTQNKAKLFKNLIITLVFEKNVSRHAMPCTGLPDGLFSNQKSQFGN
jgi:hypothetical protein